MSLLASKLSSLRGALGMLYAGWLPFTTLYVQPVDLTGRNALVSGANVGIGYEIALKLARFGANVWLLCRDPAKADAARAELIEQSGNQNITVAVVDFSSQASVQRFANEWKTSRRLIDILINNAGTVSARFVRTTDGHEVTYQSNLLSHALLVLSLLPHFADNARIVNITSHGQYAAKKELLKPNVDLDGLLEKEVGVHEGDEIPANWSLAFYERSKALQVIFGRQLQQRLSSSPVYAKKNIVIHSCHPGLVKSTIWERPLASQSAKFQGFLQWMVSLLGVSCEQGACTPVFLATAPEASVHGGGYWDRMSERTPNILTLDDTLGDELWNSWMTLKEFEGLSKDLERQQ